MATRQIAIFFQLSSSVYKSIASLARYHLSDYDDSGMTRLESFVGSVKTDWQCFSYTPQNLKWVRINRISFDLQLISFLLLSSSARLGARAALRVPIAMKL